MFLAVTGLAGTAHAAGYFESDGTRAAAAGEPAPVLKASRSAHTRGLERFLAIRRPAGLAAGDVMVAGVTVRLATARRLKAPAGWTLVRRNGTGRRGRLTQAVFVKLAGLAEPARYRFRYGTRSSAAGGILAYSGVDPARPVDAGSGRASARARAARLHAPGLLTGMPNVRVVGFFGHAGAMRSKPPAGAVERFDKAVRASNPVSSQAVDLVQETPGPIARMAVKAKAMRGRRARPAAGIAQLVGLRPAAALPILAGIGPAALVTAPPLAGVSDLPDVLPPDTEITTGPSGVTDAHDAMFAFRSEAGATFTCRLDLGTWQACSSPKTYTSLAEGAHSFEVRAKDAEGNVDPVPAVRLWTISDSPVLDTTPPETTVSSGPPSLSNDSAASFAFASSEDGSTFECRLDSGAWGSCSSPRNHSAVADGAHTFAVRATDKAGNTDESPATRAWRIDTAAPATSISGGPSGTTSSTSASFSFTSSESGSSYQCRLDSGSWGACTSPKAYSSLADGSHTFRVRATDAAGNTDGSAATRAWTVDTTAPSTTITGGPSGTTDQTSASFTFSSSETGSAFTCRIDGGAWGACTSPKSYSGLAEGGHTFDVRATDGAGNTDPSPASRSWTVDADPLPDLTPPNTTLDGGPSGTVSSTSASFAFSSSEGGSTFECRLDAGAWGSCTSPKAYSSLAEGSHTFDVRATDAAGNTDATPASRTWTIDTTPSDTTPPNTTIGGGPSGSTSETAASFTFSSSETGSTFQCRLDSGSWGACTSPKAYSGLGVGAHTFDVRATDAAGNTDGSPASRTWTITGGQTGSNCMADPSVCGFPDVENTGVTPGTTLTPVSGTVTLSTAGQVYENKLVTGSITVTAPNVTIRNVKLVATDEYYGIRAFGWQNNTNGLLIENVEIDANGRLGLKGIAFDGYTARKVFFHNGSDCAHMGGNVTIEDSLCMSGPDTNDDGWPDNTSFCNGTEHFDGLQSDGGNDIVIRHNTIRNPCHQTSAILMSTNTAGIRDVTITGNLMAGGGYTLYCNAGPDVPNEVVTNNRFSKRWFSGGGQWGHITGCDDADVYSGNVWDETGAAA